MAKYDPKLTEEMVAWLRGDHTDDESIRKGAMLLLRVNRNKGLYERICRTPRRSLAKLEYEVRKHVNIRLSGYTIQDIEKLDAEIMPQVKTVAEVECSGDDVIPVPGDEQGSATIIKGKRPDHDSLPEDIQAIWPANAERWKKIKETYNLLLSLNAPCDRFEHLQMLKESWYKYRSEMCRYDDFKASAKDNVEPGKPALSDEDENSIRLAQSYISRYLPGLKELVLESREPDFANVEKLESLRAKLQERVNTLLKFDVVLSDQRKEELLSCDIALVLPSDDAKGEGSE